ncbi:MAG TPA: YceI family protein [Symbiobacteriaceae bacterium]|jgi:polyisoprenoid-binding protein YceI
MHVKMWLAVAMAAALLAVAGCGGGGASNTKTAAAPTPAPQGTEQPAPAGKPAQGSRYAVVPEESATSYSVHEQFLQRNLAQVAVGKTSVIKGDLVLDGGSFKPSTVTVDMRTLQSPESKRDQVLHGEALESDKFPMAEFNIIGVEGTAPTLAAGGPVPFKLTGTMKLHGVEKPVTFDSKAQLQGDTLTLDGTVQFKMPEFGIKPPNRLNIISVDENVQLDVHLTAKKY